MSFSSPSNYYSSTTNQKNNENSFDDASPIPLPPSSTNLNQLRVLKYQQQQKKLVPPTTSQPVKSMAEIESVVSPPKNENTSVAANKFSTTSSRDSSAIGVTTTTTNQRNNGTTTNVKRWGVLPNNQQFPHHADAAHPRNENTHFLDENNHDDYLERGISVVSSESSCARNLNQSHRHEGERMRSSSSSRSESVSSNATSSSSSSYVIFPSNKNRKDESQQRQQQLQYYESIREQYQKSIQKAARKVFATWRLRIELRKIFVPKSISPANHHNHLVRQISGPLNFLSLQTTFSRWAYHALRRRNAREVLADVLCIQRDANSALVESYFDKWIQCAATKRLDRDVTALETKNHNKIRLACLQHWQRTAQRWHNSRIAIRALSSTFYITQCVLLARYFFKFRNFPKEKARRVDAVKNLAESNRRRHVALTLWRWQRRLTIPYIVQNRLMPMRRQSEALLARTVFEKWIKWSCNRMTALMLEQRNLRKVAKVYFRYWRRHTHRFRVVLPCLENIKSRGERKLSHGFFHKWKRFVERGVLSLGLEQKTFILLLQRYFLKWKATHLRTAQNSQERDFSVHSALSVESYRNNNTNESAGNYFTTTTTASTRSIGNNNQRSSYFFGRTATAASSPINNDNFDSPPSPEREHCDNDDEDSTIAERRLSLTRSSSSGFI